MHALLGQNTLSLTLLGCFLLWVALQPMQVWDASWQAGRHWPGAYPQQPPWLQSEANLNTANTEEKVKESLICPDNGRAKGYPSKLLRNAKLEPQPKKRASVNVWAPVLAQILNAAIQVGLFPSQVDSGLVTLVFLKR
ncbi:hypothetical protein CVIRNUC_000238 [Coccomyxa viridis]|uniref:Uncharacterized protein n=1 Tax=Coccomyxa viridis TaxID=1274662 RepID=A0AAV1HPY5_9CHLO|nr:hypothetical protein CVIRNUC_000238 [Coccomyxa viridis]